MTEMTFTSSREDTISRCFRWNEQRLGDYLCWGRGYLLPGTSIMGQVMKEGLQYRYKDRKKEPKSHKFA